jgi:hypothetical protein
MTDFTAQVQVPTLVGSAPTYNVATASDTFDAVPNARYEIHYKNGATTTGGALPFKITDPTTPIPAGSSAVAGFADVVTLPTGMLASTESTVVIDNSTRFRNAAGKITLTHQGTLTTVTFAIKRLP